MVLAEKVSMIAAEEPIIVREKAKSKFNFKKVLSLTGCMLCLMVGNVIVQGLVVEKNYQIRHWEQLVQEQEQDMMKLKINIANLESFDRVQTIAANKLGMKTVGPNDYQMIPAVPAEAESAGSTAACVAQASEPSGVLGKIAAWLGGVGKTMANPF